MSGSDSEEEMLEGVDMEDDEEAAGSEGAYDEDDEDAVEASGRTTRGTAAGAPPPKPRAPPKVKQRNEAYEEARRVQKERLTMMKQYGTSLTGADASETRERRLRYLMSQSEVFAHFMEENSGAAALAASGKTKKSGARTKLSEAAEDANLMKTAQSKMIVTRVMEQPTNITATMRAYQLEGLNWLVKLYDNGINGILADEMGLGKTLQSISLLAYLHETRGVTGPHICIVPKSVVNNWCRELRKWCPTLRPVKLLGTKDERARVIAEELQPDQFDVCVTSYEGVLKEKAHLMKFAWQYLIIDEAHRIKNPNSSLSKVVRLIPTKFRLLVTGTPLQNNLNELWALLNFLLPDIFSSEDDFGSWFSMGDDSAKENVVKKLHTVLRPFMLRRIKKDVEKSLPPKREVKLYIGLTQMQRTWYTKLLSKEAHTLNALGGPERTQLLNILMQLRKVCNHPYLFEGAEPGPPFMDGPHLWENAGKLVLLSKLLPRLRSQGSRVLIFSQMTRMLDILEDYMRLNGHQYCRIDGSTSGDDRDSQMDVFNEPGSTKFAFLLSTRAGGLGINLATADIVVLYDSDWNPQVDLQAMDRAHRIGQTKPVTVFRFVTEGTVEEKIIERADRKLFLDAAVVQQGRLAEQNSALNKTDLMAMVRFGADEIFNTKEQALTDDDIDTLLRRGEERTEAQKEKIQTDVQHNLANFSLTTTDEAETSLFDFDGENYRGAKGKGGLMINLPQRERKRNYDVDEYFRDALRQGEKPSAAQQAQRKRKGPQMHDFQFFERAPLEALLAREEEQATKRADYMSQLKELRSRAPKSGRASEDGGGADEISDQEAALEESIENCELSPKEAARKSKLLAEGFGDWTRKDMKTFCTLMGRFGRTDVDKVARTAVAEINKTESEVKRYHGIFWKRYKEVQDWERIVDNIEKGEKRLQRALEIRAAIAAKIKRHPRHWQVLPLNYGASRGKVWTEEEDTFLINQMHNFGYGNWERIKLEIRHAWQFNFDWFFKSRNAVELQRRADVIMRIIERENEESAKAERVKASQAKETDTPKKPAARRASGSVSAAQPAPRSRKRDAEPPHEPDAQSSADLDDEPPVKKSRGAVEDEAANDDDAADDDALPDDADDAPLDDADDDAPPDDDMPDEAA